MGLLKALKFSYWDGVESIVDLAESWVPADCKTEKDFERSLFFHFESELPKIKITPQYAKGRVKADIVLDERVIVELKTNFQSMGQLQRLVGQLGLYKNWGMDIIVLLTGKTDSGLKMELERAVRELFGDWNTLLDHQLKIIEKPQI